MGQGKLRLKDKVVIITGGAQGIGRTLALGTAEEGARVVVADIDPQAAELTTKDILAKGGEALALKVDVSIEESTKEMAKRTVENFGSIDVLVNNAAIFGRVRISKMPFFELALDEWDRVMMVNVKGPLLCCRAVYPQMKTQNKGKIINMASNVFFGGNPNYIHYVASKGALIGMTRSMARELGNYNINVNAVAPGSTLADDPSDKVTYDDRVKTMTQRVIPNRCFKRLQYPEDTVGTVIFLASEDSDFITGQTIIVDGGQIMH